MNDLEKSGSEYPSTSKLSRQGLTAVACTVGGIILWIIQFLAKGPVSSLIVGGIVCVIGISLLLGKDSTDKKGGAIIGAAGLLVMLSKIPGFRVVAGPLIGIGIVGLIAMGIWNAIKFFIGLKKRS